MEEMRKELELLKNRETKSKGIQAQVLSKEPKKSKMKD